MNELQMGLAFVLMVLLPFLACAPVEMKDFPLRWRIMLAAFGLTAWLWLPWCIALSRANERLVGLTPATTPTTPTVEAPNAKP